MTLAVLDPWIALAKQWQPLVAALVAGLLAVLASLILSAGMIRAAKIRAASTRDQHKSGPQDLRISGSPGSVGGNMFNSVDPNLETLRSLLRSAISSLSSTEADDEIPRSLCSRIAAFQWRNFALPADADQSMRETYATFLNQFEMLRVALDKEWSPSEASAILIQLNANARALSSMLQRAHAGKAKALGRQNNN